MERCGFLDQLLPDRAALQAATEALCIRLSGYAPLALAAMKKHLNAIASGRLDLSQLQADIARSNASADLAEGVRAWQEKRAPQFRGV
jgi:enoyl-CoA hydratase/carnithine racemase